MERGEPRIVQLEVVIDPAEVARHLGYPEGRRPPARVGALLERLLGEARALVRARGAFRVVAPAEATRVGLEPAEAGALVLGLVTAGAALEGRATALLEAGEATAALVLDAAGTAAAEEAADRLCGSIAEPESPGRARAGEAAPRVPCRLSPGYGSWPLEAQGELLGALPAAALGVSLLPSFLMVPRKSVSFAMWLGAEGRQGARGCPECGLERCRYRRRPRP